MPGYRRFIAYVYEYVQGKKGDGKGFIKVEVRQGICRMSFRLRGITEKGSGEVKAYGYVREGSSSRGIFLGEGETAEGQAEFDLEMREEQMGGTGYSLSDLGGLLILGENGEIYASGWDEQPVRPDMILLPSLQEKKEENSPLAEEEAYEEEESDPAAPQIFPGEDDRSDTAPGSEEMSEGSEEENWEKPEGEQYQTPGNSEIENRETSGEPESEYREDPEYEETVRESRDAVRIADEAVMESQSAVSQKAFLPFFDEEITDCRKLTPADLGKLGRRDCGLINNNFLRYGVKNYGHLLLGKRREDGRYILGVPGIYERQESLMANMFGFPYFKECTGSRERRGRFGYWYRLIDTPSCHLF